jgi:hypothetical protein
MVAHEGRRWLVAPYGVVAWVRNARAAGWVILRRRGDRRAYAVREVPAGEVGPVLKRYVGVATATRPYFQADKDAPVEEFVAEADRHPVFELLPSVRSARTVTVDADGRAWAAGLPSASLIPVTGTEVIRRSLSCTASALSPWKGGAAAR